jgi:hypothetical protein
MNVAWAALLVIGGYALAKYTRQQNRMTQNRGTGQTPLGVSTYTKIAATHRLQQQQAYQIGNPTSTVIPTYAAPLGPYEGQPVAGDQEWNGYFNPTV